MKTKTGPCCRARVSDLQSSLIETRDEKPDDSPGNQADGGVLWWGGHLQDVTWCRWLVATCPIISLSQSPREKLNSALTRLGTSEIIIGDKDLIKEPHWILHWLSPVSHYWPDTERSSAGTSPLLHFLQELFMKILQILQPGRGGRGHILPLVWNRYLMKTNKWGIEKFYEMVVKIKL